MKVLISAYACEPGRGSEPGAGWAWTRAAALNNEVWVITRENNREAIEAALAEEPELTVHPVYLDLPTWSRWWKRGRRGARTYYFMWQFALRRRAARLHSEHQFDVAHHLTFAVDSLPAGVVGIRGLPSVWGPVGGYAPLPWRLWRWLGFGGAIGELARWGTTAVLRRVFGRHVARRAAVVVAQNSDVAMYFQDFHPIVEPNVAIDVAQAPRKQLSAASAPELSVGRSALYVGRVEPFKGIRIAVASLAEPELDGWKLRVLGHGSDRFSSEGLARKLGVGDRVDFEGHRSPAEVREAMLSADVLVLPSMHESAGWAIAESIVSKLPVVCLALGGPADLVADSGGRSVAPDRDVVHNVAAAIADVCSLQPLPCGAETVAIDRIPGLLDRWYRLAVQQRCGESTG